jgi:cell division inhibitor SulA
MSLDTLLQRADVWRGGAMSPVPGVATGVPALDGLLPTGFPQAALTEILVPREGIGELRMLLPLLARLSREDRWLAFIAPPHILYAPALARAGVNLARVLVVHPRSAQVRGPHASRDALWALETALQAGTCSAVLAWPDHGDFSGEFSSAPGGEGWWREDGTHLPSSRGGGGLSAGALRRLQLAAEAGESLGILFRSHTAEGESSPAALRLKLDPVPQGLAVRVLKRRGGWSTGSVLVPMRRAVARSASAVPAARDLHARR